MTLYVPRQSISDYKVANEWKDFFYIKAIGGIPAESITLDRTEAELLVGNALTVTATILPADADDLTVAWSSSDESVATVDAAGKVSAVGAGTATITAATANGLTAQCELSVWLRGDTNADRRVDVADVVNTNNEIVGNPTGTFIFIAADMTGDGDITVSDAVQIAQLILETPASAVRRMAARTSEHPAHYLSLSGSGRNLGMSISSGAYTAIQADIHLPEGCELAEARLGAGASTSHIIMSSRVDAHTLRVVVFSPSNSLFIANGAPIVEVNLGAGNVAELELSNVIAAQPDGSSHGLGIDGASSGINSAECGSVEISAIAGRVRITGAEGKELSIFSTAGAMIAHEIVGSDKREISLAPGVYIVKVDNTVSKLVVR